MFDDDNYNNNNNNKINRYNCSREAMRQKLFLWALFNVRPVIARFPAGRVSIEDDPRMGRPISVGNEKKNYRRSWYATR